MNDPYLSVVIPAYNEEKRITKTLDITYAYLKRQAYSWEIVVVLDGVTDGTAKKIEEFSKDKEGIRVIDRKQNRGKGYTVREGMLAAHGVVRLFTDADNSTDISHFDTMKPLFDEGCDVVIASRDPKDAEGATQAVPQPAFKRLLGNMGNLFIQIVAVHGIWDTQCGFKAFTKNASEKIFSVSHIDRWGFDIEALALARRFGFRICIIPAHWINDAESHVKLSGYIGVLLETVKIRLNIVKGVYGKKS
ncbi:MAG: dolichyl-phosphate beta-glucosyltransferase [Patescibacteria group bacterium]